MSKTIGDNPVMDEDGGVRTPIRLYTQGYAYLKGVDISGNPDSHYNVNGIKMVRALMEKSMLCGNPTTLFFLSLVHHKFEDFENDFLDKLWLAVGVKIEARCRIALDVAKNVNRIIESVEVRANEAQNRAVIEELDVLAGYDVVDDKRATKFYERRAEKGLEIEKYIWDLADKYVAFIREAGTRHPINELVTLREIVEECHNIRQVDPRYADIIISPELMRDPSCGEGRILDAGRRIDSMQQYYVRSDFDSDSDTQSLAGEETCMPCEIL